MDEEALTGGADLPGMQKASFNDAVDGFVERYIGQERYRVLAAQFQCRAGQLGAHGGLADGDAGGHGAGERHFVGACVLDQCLAHQAATGQHVQGPCWQPGFGGQFGNAQQRQRGEFAGL
ncbi:hypothetical protein D3C76_1609720 [compost metagenome]